MEGLEVSTVVYLPPVEVYEFLVDFPQYAAYSKYLRDVRQRGEGGPGTEYDLEFSWWKLTYTARSEVTAVDPPTAIDWRVTKDLRARGQWVVEPLTDGDLSGTTDGTGGDGESARSRDDHPATSQNGGSGTSPDDTPSASRVYFRVWYDSDSVDGSAIDLPAFVSLDWVVDKVRPKVVAEAERVVERVVADLEGERRAVDLDVRRYDAAENLPEST